MSKFRYLEKGRIDESSTAEFPMPAHYPGVRGLRPVLVLAPTHHNKPLQRDMVKDPPPAPIAQGGDADREARDNLRLLHMAEKVAKFCLVGWRNVIDDRGQEVVFCKEDALDFMIGLATHSPNLFTEVLHFVNDDANFARAISVDAEEKAKNSDGA